MLTLLIMAYMIKTNPKLEFILKKLVENIYFIGLCVDALHTISLGTKTLNFKFVLPIFNLFTPLDEFLLYLYHFKKRRLK